MGGNQSTDGIAAGSSGPQGWGMESAPDASPIVHTPADGQDCPVCMGGQHSSSFLGCLPRHMVLAVRAPASVMGATSGGGGVAEQEGIDEGVHQGCDDGRFHQQGQQADETAESLVGAVAAEASTGGRSRHQEELRWSPWGSIRRTTLQPSSCLGPQLGDELSHHGGGEEESSRLLHQAVRLTALQRLLHSYKRLAKLVVMPMTVAPLPLPPSPSYPFLRRMAMAAEIVMGRASAHRKAAVLIGIIIISCGSLGVLKPQEQRLQQRDTPLLSGC